MATTHDKDDDRKLNLDFQRERYYVPDEFLSDRARALIAIAERPKHVAVVEDEGEHGIRARPMGDSRAASLLDEATRRRR